MIILGIYFRADASTAIATVGPNTPDRNIGFTGGVTGTFNLGSEKAFIQSKAGFGFNQNVTVIITPLKGQGAGNYNFNAATGIWSLILKDPNGFPTQFKVFDNATGAQLLNGQFATAILHGRSGSSSLALTLLQDNAVYDLTSSLWFPGNLMPQGGSLSIAILSKTPVSANAAGPAIFAANGDINFGAQ